VKASCAIAVGLLALVAAGCGGHRSAGGLKACELNRAQRRAITLAREDIRRLRRIQAPVQKFTARGAPGQETLTGKFTLDLGSAKLPLNIFSSLLHQAKTATSLCGDCGTALETEEPVLGNRGLSHLPSCAL
jgi:hypothetical protein